MGQASDSLDLGDELSVEGDIQRIDEQVRIGRYRLCYELGAGGMATIYLARAEGPGGFAKPVAIKRIHPHLARRKDLVEMFLDEARIASLINHPNVCSTFDFGEVGGAYYLAMEYLVGEPLSVLQRRVAKRPDLLHSPRWQRVFSKIVADIGEGLHAAHELKDERGRPLNVVHRDVSPQNVFVTYDGVSKVVDFGVAFATDRITQTVTGGIKGKLGYLAPEQLARQPYDRRLDVWALGIVLWEGLTGRRLFLSRSEVDTLLAVQHRQIVPPSQLMPGLSPALDAIALRALSRPMDERYPTTRAFSRELVAYLGSSGPPITNVEVGELMDELCGDRRDVRAEVVASVMEDRPATMTFTPEKTGEVHDADTIVRAIASAGAGPAAPAFVPAPVVAIEPKSRSGTSEAAAVARSYAGVARLAVIAIAVVAVLAITIVAVLAGSGGTTTPPAAAPSIAAVAPPVVVAPPLPLPPPPLPPLATPAPDAGTVAVVEAVVEPPVAPVAVEPDPPSGVREPRRRGDMTVTSPVSVEVCYRGDCHWTPYVFRNLSAGRVSFTFRARDGRTWSRGGSVPAGGMGRVDGAPP